MIRPILFNTDMVQAILDGRKTVTRRKIDIDIVNQFDVEHDGKTVYGYINPETGDCFSPTEICRCRPGDILYVRETWHKYKKRVGQGECCRLKEFYGYKASIANSEDADEKWHPSIHMPKEAVRIFLRVNNVRVERLQDITEECAKSEGISEEWARNWWKPSYYDPDSGGYPKYRDTFSHELWESTIKPKDRDKYGWNANPWVWVIEFERADVEE